MAVLLLALRHPVWVAYLTTVTLVVLKNILQGMPYDPQPSLAPLYRAVLFAALLGLWAAGAEPLRAMIKRWFTIKWWDIGQSKPDGSLSWQDVFELASLEYERDPVTMAHLTAGDLASQDLNANVFRSKATLPALAVLFGLVMLGGLNAIIVDYLLFPRVPSLIYSSADVPKVTDLASISQNLTAYLALVAAAISIVFTYHQLRAKVRADSRQAWINDVRENLAAIVNDVAFLLVDGRIDTEPFQRLNRRRMHLELFLNPSEKDHRLLMMIIRACVIPGITIEGDAHVRRHIRRSVEGLDGRHRDLWDIVQHGRVPEGQEARDKAISYIIKLSHVVLKREWERVRHTR
ncbi:hypothetical protein GAY28_07555 [Azospirillum brasilense]|nr:hypothetical protein [Azospirillum brasilense]